MIKGINKKAVEHNLAHGIKQASFALRPDSTDADVEKLHSAAQDIFDAGYELEDMKILPAFMQVIMAQLIETGWVPKLKGGL